MPYLNDPGTWPAGPGLDMNDPGTWQSMEEQGLIRPETAAMARQKIQQPQPQEANIDEIAIPGRDASATTPQQPAGAVGGGAGSAFRGVARRMGREQREIEADVADVYKSKEQAQMGREQLEQAKLDRDIQYTTERVKALEKQKVLDAEEFARAQQAERNAQRTVDDAKSWMNVNPESNITSREQHDRIRKIAIEGIDENGNQVKPWQQASAQRRLEQSKQANLEAWMGKSDAQRIGVAITMGLASVLSGLAAGMQGRENPAIKQINAMIDRNVRQQFEAINLKRRAFNEDTISDKSGTGVQRALAAAKGNTAAAEALMKAHLLEEAAKKTELTALRTGKAEVIQGGLEQRAALKEEALKQTQLATKIVQGQEFDALMKGAAAREEARAKQAEATDQGIPMAGVEVVNRGLLPKGPVLAKMKAGAAAVNTIIGDLNKLKVFVHGGEYAKGSEVKDSKGNVVKGVGAEAYGSTDADTAMQLLRDIQTTLKSPDFVNLGVLTGPDLELLEEITTKDPTSAVGVWTGRNERKLNNLIEKIQRQWRDKLEQFGMRPMEGQAGSPPVDESNRRGYGAAE